MTNYIIWNPEKRNTINTRKRRGCRTGAAAFPEGENQIMRKIPRKYLFTILGAVLIAVLAALWQFYGSPTGWRS